VCIGVLGLLEVVDAGDVEVGVPVVADGVVLGPPPAGYVTFGTVLAVLSNKMTELLICIVVSNPFVWLLEKPNVLIGRLDH